MTNTTVNGAFGDFKDGTNGATPDYVYDNNGNVVIDLNKNAKDLNNSVGANGIKYNFLDKPEEIRIAGKGTIKIVYSADGEKLQRAFIPEPAAAATVTTYINQFIYTETTTAVTTTSNPPLGGGGLVLQAINFEEGRIRIITPTAQGNGLDALIVNGNMDLPGGKRGAYDYFVMDYQQNVRMILTEEVHSASNTATMEPARATLEESIFGQVGAANEVATTRYTPTPAGWTGNTSSNVSRLGTNSGHNIGPNTLQKVMAGDQVSTTVQYYHQGAAVGNSNTMVNNVLTSLVQAIAGSGGTGTVIKSNAGNISSQLGGAGGFINAVQPNGTTPAGNTPQAFLTVLFFDERFNFIAAAEGGVAQQQVLATVGSNGSSLTLANIKAPKNGYAYVYVSNQSNNDVYFDNLVAGITQGNIAEENHYYAYGLKIAGLSSKKLGDSYEGQLKNNYLYNGKELFDDADLNWYDYGFRNYDPQIGRFTQLDPLTFAYPFYTPYQYAGCEPIANVDLDGLEPLNVLGYFGEAIITSASFLQPVLIPLKQAASAGAKIGSLAKIARIGGYAIKASNILNSAFTSESVGQGRGVDKKLYAHTAPKEGPVFKQAYLTPEQIAASERNAAVREANGGHDDSYMLNKIHRENVERVESSASGNFPILGTWFKAGRYKLMGDSYSDEANNSLKTAVIETAAAYGVGKVIGFGIKYFAGTKLIPRSSSLYRSVGADINTTEQVLQRGGQSLTKKTLQGLKLTKEQGRNAIHELKKDLGLGNDYHGVIRGNGDYFDPSNKTRLGNLYDYLD